MAGPLDVAALCGRSFGDFLDEIAPGWRRSFGFTEGGLFRHMIVWTGPRFEAEERAEAVEAQEDKEIARKFAPILAALRDGTLGLVGIDGPVPRRVWFTGNWVYQYDEERGVDWIKDGRTGEVYFAPRFEARQAAPAPSLDEAIVIIFRELGHPAGRAGWKAFCHRVGELTGKHYTDRHIQRRVGILQGNGVI